VHVVFFNRSYAPDQTATGQLLASLCESLVRDQGCRVTVVAGRPLAAGSNRSTAARGPREGVHVVRARGTRFANRRFLGRAANYVTYFLSACLAGQRIARPDVVVALTDPPIIGLAAWLTARRFRAPLVMHYQDVFPEVAALLEDFRSARVDAVLQRVNRFLVRRASRIVALGETMKRRLADDKGAPADRIVVIPNFADTSAIVPGPRRNAYSSRHGLDDAFVVMHSGNVGLSQNLEVLLDAAALLRDVPGLRIVVQGDGVKRPELERRASERGLATVLFLPFAPAGELSEAFAAADLFVISLRRGLAGYIVPSKLYGILAAGRPFVAAVDAESEVAAVAAEHRCGIRVEPGDPAALAGAILTYARDPDERRAAGERARQASLAFDRAVHVAKYARLLHDVTDRPAARTAPAAAREI
jgi:glycosyltransferase involved in cell wall biosynthesis